MILKNKKFKKEIDILKKENIKFEHDNLKKIFNIDKAIQVFYSIVFYKLNIKLNIPQILAAKKIFEGSIIEMNTGEGKTLTIMLSAYLNYLKGEKTYITTANNYLVQRDWLLFNNLVGDLGVKSYFINGSEKQIIKSKIYSFDVVYITINNIIFDFLRDEHRLNKMITTMENIIVDEADLALIDYGTSPLYITSKEKKYPIDFFKINQFYKLYNDSDYIINKKNNIVYLTEEGYHKTEKLAIEEGWVENKKDLYNQKFSFILEQIKNMITANKVLKINSDYVIKSNKIQIINNKTGRVDSGVSFENGLHQAVEVYNKLEPSKVSDISSMITVKTFLNKFKKLSGLTGTIYEDRKEIKNTYNLNTFKMEPNVKSKRYDAPDLFFINKDYKTKYLIEKVEKINKSGQPILIGTLSVEDSLLIKNKLEEKNIYPVVLTANNEFEESEIIKNAGLEFSVTISTKIAGRGTDIVLGGDVNQYSEYDKWKKEHDKINEKGGLFVIGYERSRQRRIDNQLIGRSGRQGDNGLSVFLVSLEDDILSNFNNSGAKKVFEMLDIKERPVESKLNSKIVKKNQKNIENMNYDKRVDLYKFDDENEEYRVLINELKNNLSLKNNKKYFLNILSDYINFNLTNAIYKDINLDIGFLKINKKELDIEYILKKEKDVIIEELILMVDEEHSKILNSEFFNEFFREVYFKELTYLWKQLSESFDSIKKQADMMKMVQKIILDEYSKILENKFLNLYFDINKKVTHTILNLDNEFNEFAIKEKEKERLNKMLDYDITMGYTNLLGVGF